MQLTFLSSGKSTNSERGGRCGELTRHQVVRAGSSGLALVLVELRLRGKLDARSKKERIALHHVGLDKGENGGVGAELCSVPL